MSVFISFIVFIKPIYYFLQILACHSVLEEFHVSRDEILSSIIMLSELFSSLSIFFIVTSFVVYHFFFLYSKNNYSFVLNLFQNCRIILKKVIIWCLFMIKFVTAMPSCHRWRLFSVVSRYVSFWWSIYLAFTFIYLSHDDFPWLKGLQLYF